MTEFSPQYCPQCGNRILEKLESINTKKTCSFCGFNIDNLQYVSSQDEFIAIIIFFIIVPIIVIAIPFAILLLFDFCIICKFVNLIVSQ